MITTKGRLAVSIVAFRRAAIRPRATSASYSAAADGCAGQPVTDLLGQQRVPAEPIRDLAQLPIGAPSAVGYQVMPCPADGLGHVLHSVEVYQVECGSADTTEVGSTAGFGQMITAMLSGEMTSASRSLARSRSWSLACRTSLSGTSPVG